MAAKSTSLGLAVVLASGVGCDTGPRVTERGVTVHVPRSCAFDPSRAEGTFFASGDFSLESRRDNTLFIRDFGGATLAVPAGARAFTANVTQDGARWLGVAPVRPDTDVDVLLWPENAACVLTGNVEAREGFAAASIGESRALVVGGQSPPGTPVPRSYVLDLASGTPIALPVGLRARRRNATVTGFAGGALVVGGDDPDSGMLRSDAEVFLESEGDFSAGAVVLSDARTDHNAVLLASGEILVVGGRGPTGLLRGLEAIDPRTARTRTAGLVTLTVPRSKPQVLRLASGEILIAGGFDANGAPVPTLEWLAPDASRASKRPRDLIASRERDFLALDSGGALAVIVPDDPSASSFPSVWRITADGSLEPARALAGLTRARLVSGASGAPYLFTGAGWQRYLPWLGGFVPALGAPPAGPPDDAKLVGEPSFAAWVRSDGGVAGLRFGVIHATYNIAPVDFTVDPGTFAPDRLAGDAIRHDPGTGLRLGPDGTAFLSDVRFADVDAEYDNAPGASATLVFRSEGGEEVAVGSEGCPMPEGTSFRVERRAREVRVGLKGGPQATCTRLLPEGARVAIGLRGRGLVLRFAATRR